MILCHGNLKLLVYCLQVTSGLAAAMDDARRRFEDRVRETEIDVICLRYFGKVSHRGIAESPLYCSQPHIASLSFVHVQNLTFPPRVL